MGPTDSFRQRDRRAPHSSGRARCFSSVRAFSFYWSQSGGHVPLEPAGLAERFTFQLERSFYEPYW